MVDALPPLASEDHACAPCGMRYADVSIDEACAHVAAVPAALREAVHELEPSLRHGRPTDDVWSVAEYVCHLRDVAVAFTIRLHRARTEDRPALEPVYNDLRARRFRYDRHDVPAVLAELEIVTPGLLDEVARFRDGDWDRTVTRLPHEERTARWLLRQAAHEGVHHVADVRRRLT
ncbi:DinB family protein [Actinomycetospora straminea]|uniref:DinB-like domain-containing protein n=1 Tax=Actinomycetospora straminea TaxID=663607 RepID=A0ABP9E099_9PSEU|nr:DinB family protein [Actinomycetospora straminea]MDD7931063.1 DinB family protein [Actinomycetospora straminea]